MHLSQIGITKSGLFKAVRIEKLIIEPDNQLFNLSDYCYNRFKCYLQLDNDCIIKWTPLERYEKGEGNLQFFFESLVFTQSLTAKGVMLVNDLDQVVATTAMPRSFKAGDQLHLDYLLTR